MSKFRILVEENLPVKHSINFGQSPVGHTDDEENFHQLHAPKTNNETHTNSIHGYTVASSRYNKELWGSENNNLHQKIENVSNGLKSADPAHEDFHVYTGINGNKNKIEKGDLHIPAFTSTSTSIHRAAKFVSPEKGRHTEEYHPDENGNMVKHTVHHILKIKVKKGQQVGAYIANHSNYSAENEFLINKNHTIHITGDYEDHHMPPERYIKSNPPRIYRVHHATVSLND